MQKTLKIEIKY